MNVLRWSGLLTLSFACLLGVSGQASALSEESSELLIAQGPATSAASQAPAKTAASASKSTKASAASQRKAKSKAAAKSKSRKKAEVIANELPEPKLDLSLPKDLVKKLDPSTQALGAPSSRITPGKPLLPSMFNETSASSGPFQLNGRLLSNEMQLQLRNDAREVEGAALEFEFKQ